MGILQVARQFYPKIGGIESCVLNLSRGLVQRGHRVEVVTLNRDLRTGQLLLAPPEVDSIPVYRIPYIGSARYPIAPAWFRFIDKFDVIHIHAVDFFIDSAAASRFMGLHRKPIAVTTHGGIFHTKEWKRPKDFYWRHVLRRSLEEADRVIAVSGSDAKLFASIVPAGKMVTIPNGTDAEFARARAARARRRMVAVGRITRAKAVDKISQLRAKVSDQLDQREPVVVGPHESNLADSLRPLSRSVGRTRKVRFVGE